MLAGQLANRGLIHYMGVAVNAVQGMCAKIYVYFATYTKQMDRSYGTPSRITVCVYIQLCTHAGALYKFEGNTHIMMRPRLASCPANIAAPPPS